MVEKTSNKRIAKNTLLLYFRMMITMLVTLYTSRVVLKVLGVYDFGIYETVGGVIGVFSFLQGALASGSTRFLAYEIGVGDEEKMKSIFSSILYIHILLAVVLLFLSETIGLWFVYNKLNFDATRFDAAVFAYHFSVAAVMFSIIQIPYTASIMSHERMGVYAYLSIVEVLMKLAVVYVLLIYDIDKLKLYSIMILLVQAILFLWYILYCRTHFRESKSLHYFDYAIIKNVLTFSFWNLLTNMTLALKNQGAVVLVSVFFSPSVVTGRAVASKVNLSANQFANNFRIASNPQIIKSHASGDSVRSRSLTLQTARFSFFLMLFLSVPIMFASESILHLWLGQVPEYSVGFLQLALATSIVDSMSNSFYTALCAVGRLRRNSILCAVVSIITIPVAYICYRMGAGPLAIAWVIFFDDIIISFVIKPYVLVHDAAFKYSEIFEMCLHCAKVLLYALPIPLLVYWLRADIGIYPLAFDLIVAFVSFLTITTSVWYAGFDNTMRKKIIMNIKSKISNYGRM